MAKQQAILTDAFLKQIIVTAMKDEVLFTAMIKHLEDEDMPTKEFSLILKAMAEFYLKYKTLPQISDLVQKLHIHSSTLSLLSSIEHLSGGNKKSLLEELGNYIRQVRFQRAYKEIGELYNKLGQKAACDRIVEFSDWYREFQVKESDFVNVIATFSDRYESNKTKEEETSSLKQISRFYIDELDVRNGGQDLRGQLTCILAATGVGKSHAARWIGKNACQIDGLNVLHVQLEGSEDEVVNAYSASLVACNTYRYSTGKLPQEAVKTMEEEVKAIAGNLFVRSFPKFNLQVSTLDIRNLIQEFFRLYRIHPDVVIIDSMDLLVDATTTRNDRRPERAKRIAVANDLKDLAAEENVWMVATYQSTVESREWINDENNVLTEYNTSEAKGLARPVTHLLTLNQSDKERKEHTMRINIAKSRFFEKGEPIKIATNYNDEQFYDRKRTLNINKVL